MSRRERSGREWEVRASTLARGTHNLIRNIVENLQVEPNPDKRVIALSVGNLTLSMDHETTAHTAARVARERRRRPRITDNSERQGFVRCTVHVSLLAGSVNADTLSKWVVRIIYNAYVKTYLYDTKKCCQKKVIKLGSVAKQRFLKKEELMLHVQHKIEQLCGKYAF
ncbi:Tyrosine aminotransferase [Eumeta japonica]|uniref:Tyrosine aminotransferase n=1 Tax=Eumeta variegata TaxID=151549 RepID=A0A4C1XST7_EUMVA|nr:Tyrosine aminotransferase [Eumeta japonica]